MKKRTIIDLVLIFGLLIVLIFLGTRDYSKKEKKDNKRFDKEYSMVSNDNVFTYVDEDKVLEIIEKGEGIIFMAFKENKWSNYYAEMLNTSAKFKNIKEIYYYNFLADREKQSVKYKKIVEFLKPHLQSNDIGEVNIYAPCLIVLKSGNVMAFDDETTFVNSDIDPKKYWTEENRDNKLKQFNNIFTIYLGGTIDGGEE